MRTLAVAAVAAIALTVTGCSGTMSSASTAEKYLGVVCPPELAVADYQAALDASDLAAATDAAATLASELEDAMATLSTTTWEGIDPADVTTIHDAYERDLQKLQSISAPGTMGDQPFIFAYPGLDEATWRIHETLELPKLLADACATTQE